MENDNMEDWFAEEWTMDGFKEAGEVLEEVLDEVLAFVETTTITLTESCSTTNLGKNQKLSHQSNHS